MQYKLSFLGIVLLLMSCTEQHTRKPTAVWVGQQQTDRNMQINTDSLRRDDTARVTKLINDAYRIRPEFSDSSMNYINKALNLSYQINFVDGIAACLYYKGLYFLEKPDYKAADLYFHNALSYCKLVKTADNNLLPWTYQRLAQIYGNQGEYDSAIYFYHKALGAAKKMKEVDTVLLVAVNASIGAVLGNIGQLDQAVRYFNSAIELAVHSGNTANLYLTYFNMGNYYRKNQNAGSALYFFYQSLPLYQALKSTFGKKGVQRVYTYIADVWGREGDKKQQKLYLDSAVAAYKEGVAQNYNLLIQLGYVHFIRGEFEKAIQFNQQSLKFTEGQDLKLGRLNNYTALAVLYDTIGKGHLAYQYHRKYAALKDSMLNEKRLKDINELEIQYRSAEKDKELARKELLIARQQNKIQQQYLWIAGGIGSALLSIIIVGGLLYRRKHKIAIARLKASLEGEEKERLRMAAELHDGIVSKLSSVKMNLDVLSSTYAGDQEEAEEFIETLQLLDQSIAELRTTSQNLQPSILKKAGLELATALYCQQISKVSTLDIHFQVIGKLPPLTEDFQLNIYRIVQELVQNIVKHAKADKALVQFTVLLEKLLITIEDNGVGMLSKKMNNENGIGLSNLQGRLTLLNGSMEIVTHNGTSIHLEFDLKQFVAHSK